jgi:2'-5' RNA ligase
VTTGLARAFLAVVPPAPVLDAIEEHLAPRRGRAPQGVRWVPREQWHLTVRFLGRVGDLQRLVAGLDDLAPVPGPALRIGGVGAFPDPGRAAVLWAGVDEGARPLEDLARRVEALVTAAGQPPDARPFHGHLTLARLARPRSASAFLEAWGGGAPGARWAVRELVLFESDTRPDGARHTERARVLLGA